MANIYELTEGVKQLQDICLNEEVDLTEDEFGQMIELSFATYGNLEEKITAYGKLIKNLAAEAEAVKSEKQLLHQRQSAIDNKVARLKESLHQSMAISGITKVDGIPKVALQKNPPSIDREKTDMEKVAEDWLSPPADRELDAKKVLAHFKETGDAPDGVVIITDRTSVRIR